MPAPLPADEAERLRLLDELRIVDTPEPALDAIARLAAEACACSIGSVCLIDGQRLWLNAAAGMQRTPLERDLAFCAQTIVVREPVLVEDARLDPRFAELPMVVQSPPTIRRYAAAPIIVEGRALGTVAALDPRAAPFPSDARERLADLARLAADLLAARLAEQRWKFALDAGGQGMWDWDLSTQRIEISPGWRAMLGIDADWQPPGPHALAADVHPDDFEAVRTRLLDHLRGRTEAATAEHRLRHRDGRWLWVVSRGKVVRRDAAGRAVRMVGTVHDITEQRAAAAALRERQAAELASQAKDRFLSRMSHEMRTPLNAVLGFTQLLLAPDMEPARVREYAGHSLRAGRQLLELIDNVLDLQRLADGRLPLQIESVALRPLVERAADALREQAQACGVHLCNEVEADVRVQADAEQLLHVIAALSSNAIKYNRPAGTVRWSAQFDDARASLLVEDSGAGLSGAQMARLFQPFERLGRETGPVEGTGLGLIIARSLVEKMAGRLTVTSRPGVGTRVSVDLPRALADAPRATVPPLAAPAPPPSEQPLKLLYVEDNRVNALLFSEALRVAGNVELRIAEDGPEAVDAVSGPWRPDVLVLDAHLPGMSGYQVLERLRAMPGLADTPAVMCSADAHPDDIARARAAGFVGYWSKPIEIARVLADLQQLGAAR